MATAVKRRRGTTAQHATFTGQLAELTVNTDTKDVHVHDGATPGGFPIRSYVNVKAFGAKGDGATNDTVAVQAAYDAIKALGGTMYFPPGDYPCNLIVKDNRIRLLGEAGVAELNTSCIRPYSSASPTITIGDDSGIARLCAIEHLTVSGTTVAAAEAPAALRLGGGAVHFKSHGCNFAGGTVTVHIEGGAVNPATCNFFSNFHIRNDGASASSRAIKVKRAAGSYSTGNYFTNGHVNGPTAGYTAEGNGDNLHFVNVYMDMHANCGVYLTSSFLVAQALTLDPGAIGVVIVEINDAVKDPSRYIIGTIIQGGQKLKMSDATTVTFPANTTDFTNNARHLTPFLGGTVYINDLTNPFGTTQYLDQETSAGPLRWNGSPFKVTDTTNASGLNTGSLRTLGGASITKDLHVGGTTVIYGGNAQAAGQITAVSGTGGLWIEALGSAADQNIRIIAKGAGVIQLTGNLKLGVAQTLVPIVNTGYVTVLDSAGATTRLMIG